MIKNKIIVIASVVFMTGCATNEVKPELPPITIVRNQLVVVTLPDEFFEVPMNIPPLDTTTATQKEVALWVIDNENRTNALENKIIELKNYFILAYEKVKANAGDSTVIVVDPSKMDESTSQRIKDVAAATVIVPEESKEPTPEPTPDPGVMTRIKNFFFNPTEPAK